MYYPCSENKGADQLRGDREADLRLCFRLCKLLVFSCTGSYRKYKDSKLISGRKRHQENISVKCIPFHTPVLYSKTGVCRDISTFLIFAPKTCTHNLCFV